MSTKSQPDSVSKILGASSFALYHHSTYFAADACTQVVLDNCQIIVYIEQKPICFRKQ